MSIDEWNEMATKVLKAELARAGVNYEELIKRLKDQGSDETYKGLSAKINRGTFSFTFFIQCMTALGKTEIRLD
jgi:Domain of unknown function (DUF6471)